MKLSSTGPFLFFQSRNSSRKKRKINTKKCCTMSKSSIITCTQNHNTLHTSEAVSTLCDRTSIILHVFRWVCHFTPYIKASLTASPLITFKLYFLKMQIISYKTGTNTHIPHTIIKIIQLVSDSLLQASRAIGTTVKTSRCLVREVTFIWQKPFQTTLRKNCTGIMYFEVFVVSQYGKNLQTLIWDLMGWWLKYIRKGRSNKTRWGGSQHCRPS